ncbi:hypothetical protein VTN31DRAFT_1430 [Thermomyces dupontii]|uniref:uncharacterized protein n=1 Tax=Talaromyces thermophilus TaxID=28565 RepID=UPI003742079C
MDYALLNGLLFAKRNGFESDKGNFKAPGWDGVVTAVQATTNQPIEKKHCENRWRKKKQYWKLWVRHRAQASDWTWDADKETFVNDRAIMDEYFRNNPQLAVFRDCGPTFRTMMEDLLDNKGAEFRNGAFATGLGHLGGPIGQAAPAAPVAPPSPVPVVTEQPQQPQQLQQPQPPQQSQQPQQPQQPQHSQHSQQPQHRTGILPETVAELRQLLVEINQNSRSSVRSAIESLLQEADDLLPDDWKENGVVRYEKLEPILDIFQDPVICDTYLALRSGRKEYRLRWILRTLERRGLA